MPQVKPNGDVVQYIREARKSGFSDVVIVKKLLDAGWSKPVVRVSLAFVGKRSRVRRVPRLRSHVATEGMQERKRKKKSVRYIALVPAVLILLIGLFFKVYIVNHASVLGSTILDTAFRRSIRSGSAKLLVQYSDSGKLVVRQFGKTLSLSNVMLFVHADTTEKAIPLTLAQENATTASSIISENTSKVLFGKITTASFPIFSNIEYNGVTIEHGVLLARYRARFSNTVLKNLFDSGQIAKLPVGEVQLPEVVGSQLRDAIMTSLPDMTIELSVDVVHGTVIAASGNTSTASLASLVRQALEAAVLPSGSAQSAQVVDAVKKIGGALEQYKQANGGYPEQKNGAAQLPSSLLSQWPVFNPSPSCSEYYNDITYIPGGTQKIVRKKPTVYSDFSVTFCLPEDVGEYKAGIGVLTPQGLLTSTTCPNGVTGCFSRALEIVDDSAESSLPEAHITFTMQ